jgi:TetR/AcrR family fatty acid metabolism transcriptional regulator
VADYSRAKTRKDRIMDAALRIFAEKGFQNATITEISKDAGVSEATIYEYFGTKEDLLFAIPEKISNAGFAEMEKILPFIKGVEGKMRAILHGYVHLYETNPHYSALVLLQLTSNKRFRETTAHAAIRRSAHTLLLCIREGIAEGIFRKDANPYLIRSILLGTIEHLFIHWHMQGRPKDKPGIPDLLDPFIEIVLEGLRAKKSESGLMLKL